MMHAARRSRVSNQLSLEGGTRHLPWGAEGAQTPSPRQYQPSFLSRLAALHPALHTKTNAATTKAGRTPGKKAAEPLSATYSCGGSVSQKHKRFLNTPRRAVVTYRRLTLSAHPPLPSEAQLSMVQRPCAQVQNHTQKGGGALACLQTRLFAKPLICIYTLTYWYIGIRRPVAANDIMRHAEGRDGTH
ncbi:hypothetical protein NDU88_001331 [Pleurodeles waltl]|uniref:Uncharacterized protein n=1 Tax=Pleurodeles waltl TaxID=8319 RepID=A0AAV7P3H1_PLEWA|nr:hypothetical protein NDU88_001331 [Pleurodeles waltl]